MPTTNDQQPRRHVAVCAFPFGTHAAPLLRLVKRIAAGARDVRFTFFNSERSNAFLFKTNDNVSTFPNIVPCNIRMPAGEVKSGINPIERFIEFSPEGFRQGMEEAEAEVGLTISCIVADAFLWFCGEIAEEKGLSWVPLWTAGPASLTAHINTDVIRSKFGVVPGTESRGEELVDCVPGLSNIRISDLPMGIVAGDLNSPFSQMLHKMGLMLPKATAVVLNAFEELSPVVTNDLKSKMRLLCVGPFPLTSPPQVESDQYNCLAWLDKHEAKSVAYISFGTVVTLLPQQIEALAKALEVSGVPFLWSMSDSSKELLPPSFIDRINEDEKLGKIVPWAPQMKILAHPSTGVFVTHCGWNSIMESIVAGVPLICRPMLGDQALNQRVIECDLRFGIGIEGGFTQSGTICALHEVLSSDKGKQMRKNVEALKELAEECIKPGGSSNDNFDALINLVTSPSET